MQTKLPQHIKLVEVGPRDGLQNETKILPVAVKLELIEKLIACGLTHIEATSFVSAKKIPQLTDAAELASLLPKAANMTYSALVPNLQGLENAIKAGIKEICFFTAVSETFCQKNIHCSIQESLERLAEMIPLAKTHQIKIRGYLSCVLGCPYEGKIHFAKTAALARKLIDLGCYEVSLGDTIGVGTAGEVQHLLHTVAQQIPMPQLAVHFHDTYGQALANIYAALQCGIRTIDSSVGGLGGCPYAKGASGNVATEDVVYLLEGLGIKTHINLHELALVGKWINEKLGHETHSKAGQALILSQAY